MQRIVRCLLRMLELLGITALCTVAVATIVALWHMLDSPQPLESMLPGEARIYRWKYGHIFYKVLGAADSPPLVLLHKPGVDASAHEMRKIMEPIAQQYLVYAPDLLGFGLSDRPHIDYSAAIYTTLCHDFLTDVVAQPAIVLASGLSCNYVVAAASGSPTLFKGLVLLSPTALFAGEQGLKQHPLSDLLALVQTPVVGSMLYPLLSTRAVLRYELERKNASYSTAELDYLYATTHQLGAQYAPLALMAGKLAQDVSQQFESLQQPTAIIWGAHALNNARYITSQHHLSTHAQVILVPDSGLSVQEERPETVVANVRQWCEDSKVSTIVATASNNTAGVSTPAGGGVEAAAVNTPPAQEAMSTGSGTPATEVVTGPGTSIPTTGDVKAAIVNTSPAEEAVIPNTSIPTTEAPSANSPEILAYCVKCKKKVTMQNIHMVTMKNGRPAMRGTCPACGTGLYRIGQVEKE
jgi:pimeloyl-ACP methyl ester carboxylesterase